MSTLVISHWPCYTVICLSHHHWQELLKSETQLSAGGAGCCHLAQFTSCNPTNEMCVSQFDLTCVSHTEQPAQRSAQWVRATTSDRCGQTDFWPVQEQPQGFHRLPERESNPVWCLLCVLWPALLRCQKYAKVSERICQIPGTFWYFYALVFYK